MSKSNITIKNEADTTPMNTNRSADVLDVLDAVQEATEMLDTLPAVLQLLIDDFELDKTEFTLEEQIMLGRSHKMLFNILYLVKSQIENSCDAISELMK